MTWIAARTKMGSELSVNGRLKEAGFETLCPAYLYKARSGRVTQTKRAALFPSYLFCVLQEGRLADILGCHCLYEVISSGGKPRMVPESVIEEVRGRMDHDGLVAFRDEAVRERFQIGATAVIRAGLFTGLTVLIKNDLGDRILGTIDGRAVDLPEEDVTG